MATRTIVTSQPDVSCDVCERRLLRGEQPDVFLAAGRRRTVCELCAPRAAHEGWMRESDSQALKLAPLRSRRGRSLIDRLRQVTRPMGADTEPRPDTGGLVAEPYPPAERYGEPVSHGEPEPYDFLDDYAPSGTAPVSARGHLEDPFEPLGAAAVDPLHGFAVEGDLAQASAAAVEADPYASLAVEVFNSSEYPRRLAGVARSLGVPTINVRPAEHLASVVRIMVAWELCWYRYEVDLSEPAAETRILAQGTELEELAREERVGNATADDSGALSLQ
jgi:hypothetical protein